jgi:hypothetical protein
MDGPFENIGPEWTGRQETRRGQPAQHFRYHPTRPGVDPGQPFPASPLQVINSPVQVLVNGNPGEFLYAGGYSGAVDV